MGRSINKSMSLTEVVLTDHPGGTLGRFLLLRQSCIMRASSLHVGPFARFRSRYCFEPGGVGRRASDASGP
jgi:hypothetical protein